MAISEAMKAHLLISTRFEIGTSVAVGRAGFPVHVTALSRGGVLSAATAMGRSFTKANGDHCDSQASPEYCCVSAHEITPHAALDRNWSKLPPSARVLPSLPLLLTE